MLTLTIGSLAYFDTFSGMIPCKVLQVTGRSGIASSAQTVTFRLTAKRGAYKRGEVLTTNGLHCVPRGALRANGWIRAYEVTCESS